MVLDMKTSWYGKDMMEKLTGSSHELHKQTKAFSSGEEVVLKNRETTRL